MTEETPQYHPKFEDEVKGVVVGEKNTIYNYFYYSQEVKPLPDKTGETDEVLPCPYRGLFHFGPEDAEYFFGRDSFVETLFQATQTRHFIPLLGASGSGKSSVILAGLIPKLQQMGHWQFTHFRPGSDPFHGLSLALVPLYMTNQDETDRIVQARKLANHLRQGDIPLADVFAQIQHNFPNDRVLLIADQFEELYTLCAEEATRRSFLDTLINAFPRWEQSQSVGAIARSSRLVLTMRADFLGNALSYRAFADVLQNVDLKLGPMNRQELTDVIAKPAEKLGVAFEAGLVERILQDVEAEPGNLPLLEFALTELWQRRQGNQLTHATYTEIGEVQGALARHADESYGRLNPAEQQQMRRVFIQLVRPGEGAEDTRRLATKAELGDANWALVKQLADDRLVVTSRSETAQETVEVVHEALIRNWGELRGWMVTDRVFRAWQERLRGAMKQWQETQGDEGSLLRGAALVEAEENLKEHQEDLSSSEQSFIQRSVELRNRLLREERVRKLWRVASFALIPLAIVITWGIWHLLNKPESPFSLKEVKKVSNITDADVNSKADYYQDLKSLVERYKISPPLYSDDGFHGDAHISREQLIDYFIKLWNRLIEIRNTTAQSQCQLPAAKINKHSFNPPRDVTPEKSWYYDSYKKLTEETGLGNVDSPFFPLKDGMFHGDLNLTRAEMVAATNRLFGAYNEYLASTMENKKSDNSELSPHRSSYVPVVFSHSLIAQGTSVSQFTDVNPADWFYEDLQSLVDRYGAITGNPDGTFKPNQLTTRGEFVMLLNRSMDRLNELIVASLADCKGN